MIWVLVALGTIQAGATLGALYYAWRTVHESREAEAERRLGRLSDRIDELVALTAEIRWANRNTNRVYSEEKQDRLRVLVATVALDLPKTRELAERRFTAAGYSDDETLANETLAELREESRQLASSRRPGHQTELASGGEEA